MDLSWLAEPTVAALRAGLRTVAPELAEGVIVTRGLEPTDDPQWCSASAVIDAEFVVKFAWAEPPARRILHESRVLQALRTAALPLPEVVAVSPAPAMLITRRVPAVPFFAVRHRIGPPAAHELAAALAQLHAPEVLRMVSREIGPLPSPPAPATFATLRAHFGRLIRPDQRARLLSWCDWADQALTGPARKVLVHGDFHGDNHLWDPATLNLRLIIDLETATIAEPEFDLRCLPSDCGIPLFTATVTHYETLTGTRLSMNRIMAWHLQTTLADALWRTEAGIALPDNRTPADWVDDLTARFTALGISPG